MKARQLILAAAAAALGAAACSESARTAGEERTPGASSEIASQPGELGDVYPSQAGRTTTVTPGAEGGRSSAATGATEQGLEQLPAGDAGADSQQRP